MPTACFQCSTKYQVIVRQHIFLLNDKAIQRNLTEQKKTKLSFTNNVLYLACIKAYISTIRATVQALLSWNYLYILTNCS